MSKLVLIGLGLLDEKDLTLRGIEAAKECDVLYTEFYTSTWRGSISTLEEMVGKPIKNIQRSDMEEDSGRLIEEAKSKNVGIFVPGDPLVATTHSSLMVDARNAGIPVEIIHSSSIYSAVAASGLHIYKFGRTVSLPSNGVTESIKSIISSNSKEGSHTLVLCDIGLPFGNAKSMISSIYDGKVVAMSSLGSLKPKIFYGEPEKIQDLPEPFVFIIPGKLHFSEEEILQTVAKV